MSGTRKGILKPIPGLSSDLVEAIRLTIMGQEFINTGHIKNLAIDNAKIANLAVSTAKIQDLAVIEAKIGNLAVTNAKIGALAVDAAKIADLAVETAKIGNLAVIEGKIGALAVTSAKIASTIQSDNYVENQSGWFINKDGKCEFGDVKVRGEIRASAFKYGTISAVGGKLVMSEATPLMADVAAAGTSIDVADQAFQTNDLVHLQDVVGGTVQLEWMRILDNGTIITGGFRYTVTRNLDGSGANDWKKGTAVIEKGYSDGVSSYGGAWIELAGDEAGGELLQAFKRTGILYSNYTKQVWIDSEGKLKAGAGNVTLDVSGLHLKRGAYIIDEVIGPLDLIQLLRGFKDDFMGSDVSPLWTKIISGVGAGIYISSSAHGGDVILKTGTDNNGYAQIHFNGKNCIASGTGITSIMMWKMKLTDSASGIDAIIDLYRDEDNYIRVRCDTNAGQTTWWLQTSNTGAGAPVGSQAQNSGVTVDLVDHWFKLTISGTAVSLYIDNMETPKITNTNYITQWNLQPRLTMRTRNTTSKAIALDFMALIPDTGF